MVRHINMWSEATALSCYGHTSALAFQPPLYMCVYCKANPLHAAGSYPPKVCSTAANTQADGTLPCIGVRGGANRRITPAPHSQPFGGPQHRRRSWIWVHQGGGHLTAFPQPTEQHDMVSNTLALLMRHLTQIATSAWERGVD